MVVKSDPENKIPFSILPPTVTAHENDVLSAKIATINKSLKKKNETPRFSGGIWDIDDDKMDTTETANRDSVRVQLKTMLQSESPYFEIDDKMDTIETCSSESLSFLSPSFLEVPGVREMDVTEAKVPVVPKKVPDNLKKKSMDELSLERSKRCRTSSKTEIYPLQSSFDRESEFSPAEMLKESYPVEVSNAEPILLKVETSLLPQTLDVNSPTICKESQIAVNDNNMQKDGVGLMNKAQHSYQKEIDVLRKVALIFESLGTNNNKHKSYSEEVGHLQRICHLLKNLEYNCPSVPNGTLEVNKSVASGDSGGEAAFTLSDIHHNENKSTELSNHIKDNLQPVISEDTGTIIQDPCASASSKVEEGKSKSCDLSVDSNKKSDPVSVNNAEVVLDKSSETEAVCSENQSSWLEQIVNGTLPWKPIGKPPPATAFSVGSVKSNVINSSNQQSSMSRTIGALLETSAKEMLQLKAKSEPSCDRDLETDDIFEMLKNATSRGSPPPMPAFGKYATTSPSRTVNKSSLTTQDTLLQMEASVDTIDKKGTDDLVALDEASLFPKQNAIEKEGYEISRNDCAPMCDPAVESATVSSTDVKEEIKEMAQQDERMGEAPKVKPLKMDDILPMNSCAMMKDGVPPSLPPKYIPPHLRRSSNNDISKNSQETQDFRHEAKTSRNHFKTSSKTPDAYSPYQAKERKSTKIKDPVESNRNAAVLPSSSGRNLPPRLNQKSLALKSDDISNHQAQGFKTKAWSNWRKDDSPPKLNDLSSSRQSPVDDYMKLPAKDEKILNTNVEMDSSSSRSNPSECFDSSKVNRTANVSGRRQLPNERKVPNIDVKRERSAYGAQVSEYDVISLKIFDEQNAMVDERILPFNQLVQMKRKFPSLSEVVPSTFEKDKVLPMSGSAVKVFLRCVFSAPALTIPGWEIALEAYYMAKTHGIVELQEQCRYIFNSKPIKSSQVQGIVQIARKFQITEVLKNSAMFAEVQAHSIPGSTMPATIKEQKCTVSCMVSADPSECFVPLHYVKETGLGSRIESDIKNNIIFEAKSGTFCLTGLQIKLETESSDLRKEVSIFCDVYKGNKKVFDLKREKPLKKLMIIDFKQKLLVEQGESATISVLMEDACMRMCYCLTKEKEFGRCADGSFEMSFESDRKSEAKQPLFFVEKLFCTFEGRKN